MTDAGYTNGQDERMSWLRRRMAAARAMGQGAAAMARTPAFRQGVAQSGPAQGLRDTAAMALPAVAGAGPATVMPGAASVPGAIHNARQAVASAIAPPTQPAPTPTPSPAPAAPTLSVADAARIDPSLAGRIAAFNMARQQPVSPPERDGPNTPSGRIATEVRHSQDHGVIGEIDKQISDLRQQSALAARAGNRMAVDDLQKAINALQRSRAEQRLRITEPIVAERTDADLQASRDALAAQVEPARQKVAEDAGLRARMAAARAGDARMAGTEGVALARGLVPGMAGTDGAVAGAVSLGLGRGSTDPEVQRALDRAAIMASMRRTESEQRIGAPSELADAPLRGPRPTLDPAADAETERFMAMARTRHEATQRLRDAEREAPALAAEGMTAGMRAQIAAANADRAEAERRASGEGLVDQQVSLQQAQYRAALAEAEEVADSSETQVWERQNPDLAQLGVALAAAMTDNASTRGDQRSNDRLAALTSRVESLSESDARRVAARAMKALDTTAQGQAIAVEPGRINRVDSPSDALAPFFESIVISPAFGLLDALLKRRGPLGSEERAETQRRAAAALRPPRQGQ